MLFSTSLYATTLVALVEATTTPGQQCSSKDAMIFAGLADYPPAQAYCSGQYPSPPTIAVTSCATDAPTYTGKAKRDDNQRYGSAEDHAYPPPKKPTADALFEALTRQPSSTIEAVCSCISAASAATVTKTISCASHEYCDASGTCKAQRDCSNPMQCDGQSFCGKAAGNGDCFCHPDTDDASAGYCMGDGPEGQGCPDPYEDCSSNADCGGQRVCIYACCRPEPFCVDVTDYKSPNPSSTSKLFKRAKRGMNPR